MRKLLIFLSFLIITIKSFSQDNSVIAGTNIPLFYTVGYQQKISEKFSATVKFGLLTKPYDALILNLLKAFDTDKMLVNTIGEAFSVGYNIQPEIKWHFRKSYVGFSYSYLLLKAVECPSDAIENYYGVSIPNRRSVSLTLKSSLHNAGIFYGRKFQFKNPHFLMAAELSVLKTFKSKSKMTNSQGEELERLSNLIDNQLNTYYVEYGYLPSFNLYFIYKFKK
jgi:hypothetical protein